MDEEEAPSEEEGVNMDTVNITINPLTASKVMSRPREIHQTLVSNVDK